MALKDDIAAEVVERLRRDYGAIADAVLGRDKVPNAFTGNPKNPTVSPITALEFLGKRTRGMEVQQDAVETRQKAQDGKLAAAGKDAAAAKALASTANAKLDQVLAALKGMQR